MPCWVLPPRPSSQRSLLAGTPASRRSRGARPTRRCWPHTPRTPRSRPARPRSKAPSTQPSQLAALQLSGGFGAAAEARVPRRRGRRRHAGHPGQGAAGTHAHHARKFSGALQRSVASASFTVGGFQLEGYASAFAWNIVRTYTLTPGRRYSFGCRYPPTW